MWPDVSHRDQEDLAIARSSLSVWGLPPDSVITLLAVSENSTYRVDAPGFTGVLRVHRPGYHTVRGIRTELAWLNRLAANPDIPVAPPIPTASGDCLALVDSSGVTRACAMFELAPGATRNESSATLQDFRHLGRYAALLHRDIREHGVPGSGERIAWDWDHMHGSHPRWGRWQDGPGVTPAIRAQLSGAEGHARARLIDYGSGPDVYGFIHSDLRQSNVLYDHDAMTLIDFDDSGYGWYMYDFAGSVSFWETDSRLPQWQEAWLAGYRSVATLSDADIDMLPTFVMVRRLMLLAWLGSHAHSDEARELAPIFASDTADLALAYLNNAAFLPA